MILLYVFVFLILLIVCLWQASLIYAQFLGAPSVNSSEEAIISALKLADLQENQLVVDLGCGSGLTLILAAKKFKSKGIGVERSPFYYFLSKLRVFLSGESKNIKIYYGDFTRVEEDVKRADVIYLYLFDSVLANLEDWLFSNIKKEARVVSLAFSFQDYRPIQTNFAENLGRQTKIELYQK